MSEKQDRNIIDVYGNTIQVCPLLEFFPFTFIIDIIKNPYEGIEGENVCIDVKFLVNLLIDSEQLREEALEILGKLIPSLTSVKMDENGICTFVYQRPDYSGDFESFYKKGVRSIPEILSFISHKYHYTVPYVDFLPAWAQRDIHERFTIRKNSIVIENSCLNNTTNPDELVETFLQEAKIVLPSKWFVKKIESLILKHFKQYVANSEEYVKHLEFTREYLPFGIGLVDSIATNGEIMIPKTISEYCNALNQFVIINQRLPRKYRKDPYEDINWEYERRLKEWLVSVVSDKGLSDEYEADISNLLNSIKGLISFEISNTEKKDIYDLLQHIKEYGLSFKKKPNLRTYYDKVLRMKTNIDFFVSFEINKLLRYRKRNRNK